MSRGVRGRGCSSPTSNETFEGRKKGERKKQLPILPSIFGRSAGAFRGGERREEKKALLRRVEIVSPMTQEGKRRLSHNHTYV